MNNNSDIINFLEEERQAIFAAGRNAFSALGEARTSLKEADERIQFLRIENEKIKAALRAVIESDEELAKARAAAAKVRG